MEKQLEQAKIELTSLKEDFTTRKNELLEKRKRIRYIEIREN